MKRDRLGSVLAITIAYSSLISAGEPPAQFRAGGVSLTLPAPPGDFVEVGDKLRTTLFELLAPSNNRLLSAYATPTVVSRLSEGKTGTGLGTYGMVEVSRQAEYAECTAEIFGKLRSDVQSTFSKAGSDGFGDLQEEMNLRLKTLDAAKVEIGHPEMLGALFEKTDASGFAMLIAMKQGERSVTMAGGFGLIRVRQRLLFAYLYRNYEGANTVSQVGKALEGWTDAILTSNK